MIKKDRYGRIFKNPAFGIMNQSQSQLKDLLKSFALTPMTQSKIRKIDTTKETTEEYLNDLTS